MRVVPTIGRKGDVVCTIDGALGLFDRRGVQPGAGVEIEVMICAHLPIRYPEGYFDRPETEKNGGSIPALIVQPVTEDHILVEHKGFECSGSMCRTMAELHPHSEAFLANRSGKPVSWLTPGRTPIIETDNVNVGWTYRDDAGELRTQQHRRPVPGIAYVSLTDIRDGLRRIAGVPGLDQLDPRVLQLLARRGSGEGRERMTPAQGRKPPIGAFAPRRPGVRNADDKARACGEPTVADRRVGRA